jgi:hypothetical protein
MPVRTLPTSRVPARIQALFAQMIPATCRPPPRAVLPMRGAVLQFRLRRTVFVKC